MNWTYALKYKLTAAGILGIILLAILLNNFIESRNISRLEKSFTTIYEDRLLVESYIFHLYDHLIQKQELIRQFSSDNHVHELQQALTAQNEAINQLLTQYAETYLTDEESLAFNRLKVRLLALQSIENAYFGGIENISSTEWMEQAHAAGKILLELSDIQLAEGKSINDTSKKIIAGSITSSSFEISLLIILSLIILALIFSSKTLISRQKIHLN